MSVCHYFTFYTRWTGHTMFFFHFCLYVSKDVLSLMCCPARQILFSSFYFYFNLFTSFPIGRHNKTKIIPKGMEYFVVDDIVVVSLTLWNGVCSACSSKFYNLIGSETISNTSSFVFKKAIEAIPNFCYDRKIITFCKFMKLFVKPLGWIRFVFYCTILCNYHELWVKFFRARPILKLRNLLFHFLLDQFPNGMSNAHLTLNSWTKIHLRCVFFDGLSPPLSTYFTPSNKILRISSAKRDQRIY